MVVIETESDGGRDGCERRLEIYRYGTMGDVTMMVLDMWVVVVLVVGGLGV